MKNKILFLFGILLIIPLIQAGETKNIEYALNISYFPYCINNVCSNSTVNQFDNVTNITTNYTVVTCSSVCYGKLSVNGVDQNQLFFEIDTGSDRWKNGSNEFRYGYKLADLGNLSDITGIRDEIKNLTSTAVYLNYCTTNLTQCASEKASVSTSLSTKDSTISSQAEEIKKKETERWVYCGFGILAGILFIKVALPAIQGRRHPRDPTQEQFPTSAGWK